MVNNRIGLWANAILYSLTLAITGCGKQNQPGMRSVDKERIQTAAKNSLDMQEREKANVAAKNQEKKVFSRTPKTTPNTTASLLTMLLFLSQIQPGYNIPLAPLHTSTAFTLSIPAEGFFDLPELLTFAHGQLSYYPPIALFENPDTTTHCTLHSTNTTLMEQCVSACNDMLDSVLNQTKMLRKHFRPMFPIDGFYVENAQKRPNRGDYHHYPITELKRTHSNGAVEVYGWLQKIKTKCPEEQPNVETLCEQIIAESPPDLFQLTRTRNTGITQEIKIYQEAGLLILDKANLLRNWCNDIKLGRQDIATGFIQSASALLLLANDRKARYNLITFVEKQGSMYKNFSNLKSSLEAQNKKIQFLKTNAADLGTYAFSLESELKRKNCMQQEAKLNRMERHAAVLASHAKQQQAASRGNIKQRRHMHRKHHQAGFSGTR